MSIFEKPSQDFEKNRAAFEAYDAYAKSRKPFVSFNADYTVASIKKESVETREQLYEMIGEIEKLGFALENKDFEKDIFVVLSRNEEDANDDHYHLAA